MTLTLLTCHTPGCENAEHTIAMLLSDPALGAVCGPCGQPITDVGEEA